MKMNKARKSNHDQVLLEGRTLMDPKAKQKKRKREQRRRREEWEDSVVRTGLSLDQNHMLATAARANREESVKKKKKKQAAAFGWSMFNQDSLDKGHSKRAARASGGSGGGGQSEGGVSGAGAAGAAAGSSSLVLGGQPSRAAVERMVAELDEREKLKSNFSRRREVFDEEHTTHINESNRTFNKKLARAYDKHTVEIRQALERGTG
jgi:pre-mRNA-splicing factor SYF2